MTLAIGFVFYFVARLQIGSLADVRRTLRWLFIGLAASIAFAVVQVVAIVEGGDALRSVQALTDLFAVRTDGLVTRAQGMSLEPSWLATQIILLLLPALVAQLISRQVAPGARPSRAACWSPPWRSWRGAHGIAVRGIALWSGGCRSDAAPGRRDGAQVGACGHCAGGGDEVMLAGIGGIALISNFGAGAGSNYVLNPVTIVTAQISDSADPAGSVTDLLAIGGRLAANQTAFNLWLDHPLAGVSLGNNYRYFARYAPDWAYSAGFFTSGKLEGAAWVDPNAPEKGNAKNFFLRLLSETGVAGLLLFMAFLWRQIFGSHGRDPYFLYFRMAAATAVIFSFFNLDSFADPAIWIVLALCAAMGPLQVQGPELSET